MGISKKDYEVVYAKDRKEWRKWLKKNHKSVNPIWLVYNKKGSGEPTVTYNEAVEEALCFGWIDSVINRIDEKKYKQMFSPRKPKSTWSKLNKSRIEKMIAQKLMTKAGLDKIERAKQEGTWDTLNDIEELIIPEDLLKALKTNKKAYKNFNAFSDSNRKVSFYWINNVKSKGLRKQRVDKIVELAEKNITLIQFRQS